MKRNFLRNWYMVLFDLMGFFCAFLVTSFLATDYTKWFFIAFFIPLIASALVTTILAQLQGIYRIMWRYCTVVDGIKLLKAVFINFILTFGIFLIFDRVVLKNMPLGYIKIALSYSFLSSCSFVFVRAMDYIINKYLKYLRTRTSEQGKRILIVGAGSAAAVIIHDLRSNINLTYDIIGLVDDDEAKKGLTVGGYEVLGNRNDIINLCKKYRVDEILIAMPSATGEQRKEIIEICNQTRCKIKTVPSVDQMITSGKFSMRSIEIDDILARDPIVLDNAGIANYVTGRTVLITGGGGSIGSELCRQIMKFHPAKLVIFDIYENNAYDIQMELNEKYPSNKPKVIIGSVRDLARMEVVFGEEKPDIVFHAAAHKHVPLMEDSPREAILNNIMGTYNTVKCADKFGTKKFVMISTDKAVNPTNIMGASKRMCEMIVQAMQKNSKTEFVSVRFGNVLNSNGSVIPLFKRQIAKGGPVTITHKDITRFFMTIPEAAQLVIQAGAFAKGGEIFVLDMGKPVKIYNLAQNIIRLAGYRPDIDIEIKEIGLRPGEKLYEELLMNAEGLTSTVHSKIFIGKQIDVNMEEVEENLRELLEAANSHDKERIRAVMHKAVPTFVEPEVINNEVAKAH